MHYLSCFEDKGLYHSSKLLLVHKTIDEEVYALDHFGHFEKLLEHGIHSAGRKVQNLNGFTDLECFGLVVSAVLDPFKSRRLQSEQQLDAIENNLAFSHMNVRPQWQRLIIDRMRLARVDIVDIAPELP